MGGSIHRCVLGVFSSISKMYSAADEGHSSAADLNSSAAKVYIRRFGDAFLGCGNVLPRYGNVFLD